MHNVCCKKCVGARAQQVLGLSAAGALHFKYKCTLAEMKEAICTYILNCFISMNEIFGKTAGFPSSLFFTEYYLSSSCSVSCQAAADGTRTINWMVKINIKATTMSIRDLYHLAQSFFCFSKVLDDLVWPCSLIVVR